MPVEEPGLSELALALALALAQRQQTVLVVVAAHSAAVTCQQAGRQSRLRQSRRVGSLAETKLV